MNILKGFSNKSDGNMRISAKEAVLNRTRFFQKLGLRISDLVLTELVHGNKVAIVSQGEEGQTLKGYDALITSTPGAIISVTAADCLPIYFWNKEKTVIGVAHAGWRGVKSQIVGEVINTFINKYSCQPKDIMVEIGPHIRDCHFEVQEDLVKIFSDYPIAFKTVEGRIYLNLENIVISQLTSLGLVKENITRSSGCTYCNDHYYSYRRDKPKNIEAMIAYITLRN